MTTDDELRMSFTEHLGELRQRIIYCAYALVAGVIVAYIISDAVFAALAYPLTPIASKGWFSFSTETVAPMGGESQGSETGIEAGTEAAPAVAEIPLGPKWTVLNPLEYVIVKLKIAAYGGLLLAMPVIIWQILAFVFPGLHPHERRTIQIMMGGCSVLAVLGVSVAYFGVFPLVLPYLIGWVPGFVEMQLRLNETLSILIKGILGFAIAFQFPMAVLVLVYMDLLTPQTLKEYRKMAIVGLAIVSAIFTPPDPLSMLIMLIPLALLYEMSIVLAHVVVWRRKKHEDNTA